MRTILLLMLSLLGSQTAQAMCYSLFDANNKLVYQSGESPIDMSYAISDEIQRRFPGHHLVVANSGACESFNALPQANRQAAYDGALRSPSASPALSLGRPVDVATRDVNAAIAALDSAPPSAGRPAPAPARQPAVRKTAPRQVTGNVLRVNPKLKADLYP